MSARARHRASNACCDVHCCARACVPALWHVYLLAWVPHCTGVGPMLVGILMMVLGAEGASIVSGNRGVYFLAERLGRKVVLLWLPVRWVFAAVVVGILDKLLACRLLLALHRHELSVQSPFVCLSCY